MAGQHIVIIDDDPDIREALTVILAREGHRVTCCATGSEGMATIRAERPDLIMLDIMLASPVEGYRLAAELRRDEILREIPIIFVSSYRGTLGADYARELGGDYVPPNKFLDKPLTVETVLNAVREVQAERTDPRS